MEGCIEEKVFLDNYFKLHAVLRVTRLMPHFVPARIITPADVTEIIGYPEESVKVAKFLSHIEKNLKVGHANSFKVLLRIMKNYGNEAEEELAIAMEKSVSINSLKGICIVWNYELHSHGDISFTLQLCM